MRRAIGLLLMAVCIAALLAYNLHPPEGEDSNLLVRAVAIAVTGGGAWLAWRFLVRRGRTSGGCRSK
jgi:hypothetical protein